MAIVRCESCSSAGFAGATLLWGEVRKGDGAPLRGWSRGVMTDRESRKQQVGGEVLAYVW